MKGKNFIRFILRFLLVTAGALLFSINLNIFVHKAGLLPGGFTGLTLLLQEILLKFCNINLPFSVFYWILNIIPAIICFKYVGKNFTILSIWFVVASGLFTDLIPDISISDDVLLCTIFGGIINATSIFLALLAGATSGGTDFISIFVSEKTGRNTWNAIFAGNCIVLCVFGLLFGWTRALYSIIFQYTSTTILNILYKRYQKSTLLIITDKSTEIVALIKQITNHDATLFKGTGCYSGSEKEMLYTVVSAGEVDKLIKNIKLVDPKAFINILQSKNLVGNFYMKKND